VLGARALWQAEGKPARVLPIFLEVIKDTNRSNWSHAVAGLGEVGPAAKEAIPRLVEMMKIPDYYHYELRNVLPRFGEAAIAPLVKVLEEPPAPAPGRSFWMRPDETAVYALGHLGPKAGAAMVGLLGHKDLQVRLRACRVVSSLGPAGKDCVGK